MLSLAFEIFGLASVVTGGCFLLLATYVAFSHGLVGLRRKRVTRRKGGGARFALASTAGLMFAVAGLAMMASVRLGMV